MCPHCRAFITTSDRVCPYCGEKVGHRAIDLRNPGELLSGLVPSGLFISSLIITLNAGFFLLTVIASMKAGNGSALMNIDGQTLLLFGAKFNRFIAAGQWWRLVTAGFLHGGILHIAFNGYGLFQLGPLVETYYGSSRLVVIYFASTVGGFYASAVWRDSLSVGASAGLFGLLGAMLALTLRHEGRMAEYMRSSFMTVIGINLVFGLINPVIDNAAHIGGLAAGFVVAAAAGRPRWHDRHPVERFWQLLALICILLTLLSFYRWFMWYRAVSG
jgi:rhomboid protease GluP